jgi:hypothetical protein
MTRSRPLVLAGIGWLGASLLGCERRAPGPDECAQFAEAAAGMSRDSPLLTPDLLAQIDAATRECLTAPYDRQLLSCVLMTRQTRSCLNDFRRRRGPRG